MPLLLNPLGLSPPGNDPGVINGKLSPLAGLPSGERCHIPGAGPNSAGEELNPPLDWKPPPAQASGL